MSRISLLGDGEGGYLARLAFWLSRKKIGTVPNNVRVLAHHPYFPQFGGTVSPSFDLAQVALTQERASSMWNTGTKCGAS